MAENFDTLLLLALPASGKSEVRKYLTSRSPELFHMGPTVQLDDYPYVHLQLRLDEELAKRGQPRAFHAREGGAFSSPFEWGGLIRLLNEDYADLRAGRAEVPEHAAEHLFERFDAATAAAGGERKLDRLPAELRAELAEVLEAEARQLYEEKAELCRTDLSGKTIVIEFARGGPEGAFLPLPSGYGYAGSLPHLGPALLERAAILYIWVTPEESRRKNRARARPDGQGSILFHGTPEEVMFQEYGCDDMEYLMKVSDRHGTLRVESEGKVFHVPVSRFDNRVDKTSFLRKEEAEWTPEEEQAIHGSIKEACDLLWERYVARG